MKMTSDVETNYMSDEEIDSKKHSRLIDDVLQLDKKQYVKKPTRTEPSTQVSEFNLINPELKSTVRVDDLTRVLQARSKHVDIGKKVLKAQTAAQTLNAPLEKPQAERIRRSVGFEKVQVELGKWDSIVLKNRVSSQLKFPLKTGTVDIIDGNETDEPYRLRIKTDLEKELEALEPEVVKPEEEKTMFSLNMKEMKERRKEIARLRAQQSYREKKQHRKNKIKSKKYHRLEKKAKLKQSIKEFELLKKTDPEAALSKLEELDKARAEERMSLRHKSTGHWAKNKVVKAKYNKECRQALSQQLTISRELTQKLKVESSSDSEPDEPLREIKVTGSNPWVNTQSEVDEFYSGYRKFWSEKNKSEMSELQKEFEENVKLVEDEMKKEMNGHSEIQEHNEKHEVKEMMIDLVTDSEDGSNENENNAPETKSKSRNKKIVKLSSNHEKSKKLKINKRKHDKLNEKDSDQTSENQLENSKQKKIKVNSANKMKNHEDNISKKPKRSKSKKKETHGSNQWEVTKIDARFASDQPIEDIFDDLDDLTKKAVDKKLRAFKKELNQKIVTTKKVKKPKSKPKIDMSLPRERMRPEIDEELGVHDKEDKVEKLKQVVKDDSVKESVEKIDIDPNKYMNVKPVNLHTELPSNVVLDDEESDDDIQRAYVTEAFGDDDVVSEFHREKKDAIDKDKPEDLDLTLPGWGRWTGKSIKNQKPSRRKYKRFIIKFPNKIPRKDDNRGNLIINEKKDDAIRQHQVTEVPFPFTSVKDFEASIRAPLGDSFVTQTAFRKLVKPPIITKAGAIIEPMTTDDVLKSSLKQYKNMIKSRVK